MPITTRNVTQCSTFKNEVMCDGRHH